jgi:hypothetical protein
MALTGIRCTMICQDDRYGFSETHIYNGNDFNAAKFALVALFKRRMAICGPPAKPFRGRMSLIGARRATLLLSSQDIQSIGAAPAMALQGETGSLGQNDSDQPKASLQIRLTGADGRWKNVYLAGIPDLVIAENPEGPRITFIPQFNKVLGLYLRQLEQDPWGFAGQTTAGLALPPTQILAASKLVGNGLVGVTINGAAPAGLATKTVKVYGVVMLNRALANYNGIRTIDSIAADFPAPGSTTIYLRGTEAVDVTKVRLYGTIQTLEFANVKYTGGTPIAQTTRKRGNRSLVTPGRRLIRAKI